MDETTANIFRCMYATAQSAFYREETILVRQAVFPAFAKIETETR